MAEPAVPPCPRVPRRAPTSGPGPIGAPPRHVSTKGEEEKAQPDGSSARGCRHDARRSEGERGTTCRTAAPRPAALCPRGHRSLPAGSQVPAPPHTSPRARPQASAVRSRRRRRHQSPPTARRRRAHDAAPPRILGAHGQAAPAPPQGDPRGLQQPPPGAAPRGVCLSFPARFPEQNGVCLPATPPNPADARSSPGPASSAGCPASPLTCWYCRIPSCSCCILHSSVSSGS